MGALMTPSVTLAFRGRASMKSAVVVAILLAAVSSEGQTPAKESETILSLLSEVRQLRQNIEALTVASQRTQIALYALQTQDAAVARSTRRLDDLRSKCAASEADRQNFVTEIRRMESRLAPGTT